MFAEDLFQGLDHILDPQLFPDETNALLDDVHFEARLLFGVYMAFVCAPQPSPSAPTRSIAL